MSGFKKFVMQGNLVELAVAFVIAAAFGLVVKAFVDSHHGPHRQGRRHPKLLHLPARRVHVGAFLTALVAFIILAAVVYFFVVKPYEAAKGRFSAPKEETAPADVVLLTEIRDLLARRGDVV